MPPEARGLARDEVRLAGRHRAARLAHAVARDLPDLLRPGDLLVVNTSATLPAAVDVDRRGCTWPLHVSTQLDDGSWVVELRRPTAPGRPTPQPGEVLRLPGGVRLRLGAPHPAGPAPAVAGASRCRRVDRVGVPAREHGRPIRYPYVRRRLAARRPARTCTPPSPGSAEMPSAGRPLTARAAGPADGARASPVAPVVLHTGVSSQEAHEPPQPEEFTVPAATARLVNGTVRGRPPGGRRRHHRRAGARVGGRRPDAWSRAAGWTSLVLGPDRPARVVDGLLTGLHEPEASHLDLLEAVAGRRLVDRGYADVTGPDARLPLARVRRHDAAAALIGRRRAMPQPKGRPGCGIADEDSLRRQHGLLPHPKRVNHPPRRAGRRRVPLEVRRHQAAEAGQVVAALLDRDRRQTRSAQDAPASR